MKLTNLTFMAIAIINLCSCKSGMDVSNIIEISDSDTKEIIIEKAAHIVPTANQLAALKDEFIAFVHFGPNTFTRMEWGSGKEDPKIFALENLDTDQWVEAIKDAGMKKVIITVKHHDGFVLWQSRYTKHGVMSTDFRDGKGDILRDLSQSCKKYGLKLGIYLSPADLYQIENPDGLYGNLSKTTLRTIPREIEGRPFENKTKFEFEVDDYNEYFLNQLFELLTEYGDIDELWFDGAHPKRKGDQQYNYQAWNELIHKLAPKAVIFGRQDIRWCGNESGATRDTEWNVIPYDSNPLTMGAFKDLTDNDLGSREQLYKGKFLLYQQAETNTSIREGWFYRDDTHQNTRSADDVFDIYERSVGGNSTFLLNVTPNRQGTLSDVDVEVLRQTGKRIEETYKTNLLKGAKGKKAVLDDNYESYYKPKNNEIIISTPQPITFNRLVLQEAIATHGERVEKHAVDAFIDGEWKQIAEATNIGYKRILRFADVTSDKIRVRIEQSRKECAITTISAHLYVAHPPRLVVSSDINGVITIKPFVQEFGWKPHGQGNEELNKGVQIYYTTDGSEPNEQSNLYTSPIECGNVMLKCVAIMNGERGAVTSQQTGIAKKDWKIVSVSSQNSNHKATNSFDGSEGSYWMSKEGSNHSITVDLGNKHTLKGFAYTPQTNNSDGMMAKGVIKVSSDGRNWINGGNFDFGNLINDPSKRYFYFSNAIPNCKFVKIEITEIAKGDKVVTIAEIDLI
ncbi:MAG: alpha-L-fucosidase [Rikenellaceae bacterium]